MPGMANITVKDSDGTTDRVFTALNNAGPDGAPAAWRWEDTTKLLSERPRFEVSSRWNAQKTARKVSIFFNYPILRATPVAGVNEVIGNVQLRGNEWIIPQNITDAQKAQAVALGSNLVAASLTTQSVSSGYAPN